MKCIIHDIVYTCWSSSIVASFPGRAGEGKNGLVSIVCACAGISVYYSGYYAVKFLCAAKQFTAAYAVKISRARNNRVETGHEYSELLPQECRFKPLRWLVYQAIGQDPGRLSKLLLVPVAQGYLRAYAGHGE